jgi:hypothetical protein
MTRTAACLACLALTLSLAGCERAASDPDADAADAATALADEPMATVPPEPAAPGLTPPAAPAQESAPGVTPAAPVTPGPAPDPSVPLATNAGEVPRMPVAEASARAQSGEVVIVDVRDAGSFAESHIEGAVNIPLGEIGARAGELPRDKLIVTYCA